jgi:hypothetical protein
MKFKILKIVLSALSSMFWIILIHLPQEPKLTFAIWTSIYFFPFFLLFLILFIYLLKLKAFASVNIFFHNQKAMWCNVAILVLILVISWMIYYEEITLFSFIINLSSFSFSVFVYYKLFSSAPARSTLN